MSLIRDVPERIKERVGGHEGTKVACFYICPVGFKQISQVDHYIAVYLLERTARDLSRTIAEAVLVDPSEVGQAMWLRVKGLTVLVDDDVVANMSEGQVMVVEAKYTVRRCYSERQSPLTSRDEVNCLEDGVSQGTQERLEFTLMFQSSPETVPTPASMGVLPG